MHILGSFISYALSNWIHYWNFLIDTVNLDFITFTWKEEGGTNQTLQHFELLSST